VTAALYKTPCGAAPEPQGHIDRIVRQIEGRAERATRTVHIKGRSFRRICPGWSRDDERLFRAYVERLSFERRREIDGLMREGRQPPGSPTPS
jgi:hypothetical protein